MKTALDLLQSLRVGALIALIALSAAGCASQMRSAVAQTPSAPNGISRTLLAHHDLPDVPGWESRLYLIEYGPGIASPVHHHPVEGLGYVISGSFESAFAGERPTTVRAGQSFSERPLVSHVLFRNLDAARPLKFVIAFVVRKGAPVLEAP